MVSSDLRRKQQIRLLKDNNSVLILILILAAAFIFIPNYSKGFYNVINYKTMSTLDQLKRRLTLTDSTLSHDQHTDTIYINKYTMNRNARRQFYI